jgi:hypothetical protein
MKSLLSFARGTLAAVALAVTCLLPGVAAADTLTFDDPQSCGSNGSLLVSFGSTCTTQGLTFASASVPFRGQTITISAANGGLFTVSAFDGGNGLPARTGLTSAQLREPAVAGSGFESLDWGQTITFTGTRADGTTTTFSYNNYTPNQTFTLGPSFSELVSLQVSTGGTVVQVSTFSVDPAGFYRNTGGFNLFPGGGVTPIDNLQVNVVAAVPEPSTYALFAVPLAFLVLWQRRRQRGAELTLQRVPAASAGA